MLSKKKPEKALKNIKKGNKILTKLIYSEVQALRNFQDMRDKLIKVMSVKEFQKLLGSKSNQNRLSVLKHFAKNNGTELGFDKDQAELLYSRLSRMKKMNLQERYLPKKDKPDNSADALKLYRQDPTMLVIELNKNKNLKLERKPSIDKIRQNPYDPEVVSKERNKEIGSHPRMNSNPSNASLNSLRKQMTKKNSNLSLRRNSRRGSMRNNPENMRPRSQFSISKENSPVFSETDNKIKPEVKGKIEIIKGFRNDPDFINPSVNNTKEREKSNKNQNKEDEKVVKQEKITRVHSKVVTETQTQIIGDDPQSKIPIKSNSKSSIHSKPSLKRKTSKTTIREVKKDKDELGRPRISETVTTTTVTTTTRKKSDAKVTEKSKFPNQNDMTHLRDFNKSLDQAKLDHFEDQGDSKNNITNQSDLKDQNKNKNQDGKLPGIDPGPKLRVSGPNGTWRDLEGTQPAQGNTKTGRTSADKKIKKTKDDGSNIFGYEQSPKRKKKSSKSVGAKKARSKTKGKKKKTKKSKKGLSKSMIGPSKKKKKKTVTKSVSQSMLNVIKRRKARSSRRDISEPKKKRKKFDDRNSPESLGGNNMNWKDMLRYSHPKKRIKNTKKKKKKGTAKKLVKGLKSKFIKRNGKSAKKKSKKPISKSRSKAKTKKSTRSKTKGKSKKPKKKVKKSVSKKPKKSTKKRSKSAVRAKSKKTKKKTLKPKKPEITTFETKLTHDQANLRNSVGNAIFQNQLAVETSLDEKEKDAFRIHLEGGGVNRDNAIDSNNIYSSNMQVEAVVGAGTIVNFAEAEGTFVQKVGFGPEDQIIEHLFTMHWSQRDEVFLPAKKAPNVLPTSKRISSLPHGAETLTLIQKLDGGKVVTGQNHSGMIRIDTLGHSPNRGNKNINNNEIQNLGILVTESKEKKQDDQETDFIAAQNLNFKVAGGNVENIVSRGREGVLSDLRSRAEENLQIGLGKDSNRVSDDKFNIRNLKSEESFQKVSPIRDDRNLEKMGIFKIVSGIERANVSGDHGDLKGDLNMIFKKMNFTSMEQNQNQSSLSKIKESKDEQELGNVNQKYINNLQNGTGSFGDNLANKGFQNVKILNQNQNSSELEKKTTDFQFPNQNLPFDNPMTILQNKKFGNVALNKFIKKDDSNFVKKQIGDKYILQNDQSENIIVRPNQPLSFHNNTISTSNSRNALKTNNNQESNQKNYNGKNLLGQFQRKVNGGISNNLTNHSNMTGQNRTSNDNIEERKEQIIGEIPNTSSLDNLQENPLGSNHKFFVNKKINSFHSDQRLGHGNNLRMNNQGRRSIKSPRSKKSDIKSVTENMMSGFGIIHDNLEPKNLVESTHTNPKIKLYSKRHKRSRRVEPSATHRKIVRAGSNIPSGNRQNKNNQDRFLKLSRPQSVQSSYSRGVDTLHRQFINGHYRPIHLYTRLQPAFSKLSDNQSIRSGRAFTMPVGSTSSRTGKINHLISTSQPRARRTDIQVTSEYNHGPNQTRLNPKDLKSFPDNANIYSFSNLQKANEKVGVNSTQPPHIYQSQFQPRVVHNEKIINKSMRNVLLMFFRKVLVFNSKLEGLKQKLYKSGSNFSINSLIQRILPPNQKNMSLNDISEFFMGLNFNYNTQNINKVMMYCARFNRLPSQIFDEPQKTDNYHISGSGKLINVPRPSTKLSKDIPKSQESLFYEQLEDFFLPIKEEGTIISDDTVDRRLQNSSQSITNEEAEFHLLRQIIILSMRKLDDLGWVIRSLQLFPLEDIFIAAKTPMINPDIGDDTSTVKNRESEKSISRDFPLNDLGINQNGLKKPRDSKLLSKFFKESGDASSINAKEVADFLKSHGADYLDGDLVYIFKEIGRSSDLITKAEFLEYLSAPFWNL